MCVRNCKTGDSLNTSRLAHVIFLHWSCHEISAPSSGFHILDENSTSPIQLFNWLRQLCRKDPPSKLWSLSEQGIMHADLAHASKTERDLKNFSKRPRLFSNDSFLGHQIIINIVSLCVGTFPRAGQRYCVLACLPCVCVLHRHHSEHSGL